MYNKWVTKKEIVVWVGALIKRTGRTTHNRRKEIQWIKTNKSLWHVSMSSKTRMVSNEGIATKGVSGKRMFTIASNMQNHWLLAPTSDSRTPTIHMRRTDHSWQAEICSLFGVRMWDRKLAYRIVSSHIVFENMITPPSNFPASRCCLDLPLLNSPTFSLDKGYLHGTASWGLRQGTEAVPLPDMESLDNRKTAA